MGRKKLRWEQEDLIPLSQAIKRNEYIWIEGKRMLNVWKDGFVPYYGKKKSERGRGRPKKEEIEKS